MVRKGYEVYKMDSPNKTGKEDLKELFESLGIEGNIIELDSNDPDMLSKLKDKILGHKCNFANPTTEYPSISDTELTMFLTLFAEMAKREDSTSMPLVKWGTYLGHVCMHNKEFVNWLGTLKTVIHVVNRTAALTSAFQVGVLIGLFLGRPDLVPTLDSDKEKFDSDGEPQ